MRKSPDDNAVYKMLELTGTSSKSIEDAVQTAISRANETVRNLRWFEITETRGAIENGKIAQWQVMLKAGFRLDA
jgi:flavin-binding protein dodecin